MIIFKCHPSWIIPRNDSRRIKRHLEKQEMKQKRFERKTIWNITKIDNLITKIISSLNANIKSKEIHRRQMECAFKLCHWDSLVENIDQPSFILFLWELYGMKIFASHLSMKNLVFNILDDKTVDYSYPRAFWLTK